MSHPIRVMSAPYGTQLDPLAKRAGMPEIANPATIITSDRTRHANIDIARRSLQAGARVAATNTFRLFVSAM